MPGKNEDGDALFTNSDNLSTTSSKVGAKQRRQPLDVIEDYEASVKSSDDETMSQFAARYEEEDREQEQFNSFLSSGETHMTFKDIKKVVGEHVVVTYEGSLFPGKIIRIFTEKVIVSTMVKTMKAWKWPDHVDEIEYDWDEVVSGIQPPKPINKRGYFSVPELATVWGQ